MTVGKPCPSCNHPLQAGRTAHGLHFECSACKGILVGLSVLQQSRDSKAIQRLWVTARQEKQTSARFCPGCKEPLLLVHTPPEHGAIELDVCPRCYVVWLDAGEFEKLPAKSADQAKEEARDEDRREKRVAERERRAKEAEASTVRSEGHLTYTATDGIIDALVGFFRYWPP